MNRKSDPLQNHLLAALPKNELSHLLPHLTLVSIQASQTLAQPHKKSRYVYFPLNCTVALYYPVDNGTSAEIALIGNEGMFSLVPVMGGGTMPYTAVAETAGDAYRLDEEILKKEFDHSPSLQRLLLLYTQALFTEMAQISVCGRHHSLRQQICLHLLLMHDRALSDKFTLTHQALAHMLGMRRESVTKVSSGLRKDGLIEYIRGQITMLDRAGLERECCECYGVMREEFRRLFC